MDEIGVITPPPLPPKTRRSPPSATTVHQPPSNFTVSYPIVSNSCEELEPKSNHVVKIRINPTLDSAALGSLISDVAPCSIRISVNSSEDEMLEDKGHANGFYFYNCAVMSSGQVSPSDTLDSGTCSDLDAPPKKPAVSVTLIQHHKRASSLASNSSHNSIDSDDNESSLSCDSLNSGSKVIPRTLLQDIRKMKMPPEELIRSYEERQKDEEEKKNSNASFLYEADIFYKFHLNEHFVNEMGEGKQDQDDGKDVEDDFAGYKDLLGGASTIRSSKGTVRGVKNRVRAGIATFLQINSDVKNYKEKELGKVVVYTTTMGVLRETYQACMKVKHILRTLLVKFEERDVFMNSECQNEIRDRMRCDHILVPQVFVDGQHVGDAETIERLNECGELRRILKPFKSMDVCTTCQTCGGFRLLPCQVCNGSKKSVHRNHFTAEFVALKCMNCDEVGLVRCNAC